MIHLVFCLLEGVVGLRIGVLLVALFLLIGGLVLGQVHEIKRRNANVVDVLEPRLLLDVDVELHILVAVIGVEAQLIRLFFTPAGLLILVLITGTHLILVARLAHDFLESVGLDEFDPIILVDFIHGNALVLQREEEVDELADLVRVVRLLFLDLL